LDSIKNRATDSAGSCHCLNAEARVHSQASSCGICNGQSGTVTGFSLTALFRRNFTRIHSSINKAYTYIYIYIYIYI
jgi:hypothetical protein